MSLHGILLSIILAVTAADGAAENVAIAAPSILVVHNDELESVEREALNLATARLRKSGSFQVTLAPEAHARQMDAEAAAHFGTVVVTGVLGNRVLVPFGTVPELGPEGYYLSMGVNRDWTSEKFAAAERLVLLCGNDARGLLFGLGKLLRDFSGGTDGESSNVATSPASANRIVYLATHFNNFYECAPIEEVVTYVEDLALWGFNGIWTWFDMGWYPEDFDSDPHSSGSRLLERIRIVNAKARNLGLSVGLITIANEGFKKQPTPELLADPSAKRGGYYPDSTICPGAPGGMAMILENKRRILDKIGPIDTYITWPFDQGSCGCSRCTPWVSTYLNINESIAETVAEYNPDARFLISGWYFSDEEMNALNGLMKSATPWFDGILTDTSWPPKLEPAANYARLVFPEISMHGSLFVGYGASGANPMPARCLDQARAAAAHGYGAALYSEGIYEDINKVVWACALWDPERSVDDIVREYARFYFGADNTESCVSIVLGLEQTWPQELLPEKDAAQVQRLYEQARDIGKRLPDSAAGRTRWQYFVDRAEMDKRMLDIGPDEPLLRELKSMYTDLGYAHDVDALRARIQTLHDNIAARAEAMEALFAFHWEYLKRAHLDRSTLLIATPPEFIGQRDWDRLKTSIQRALDRRDPEALRADVLRGFRQWCWHNNVTLEYIFL